MGEPGWVAAGLASTGVLGSDDKLSVSFFSSMPMGIRSGELSLPLTCSNSCTYSKQDATSVTRSHMVELSLSTSSWSRTG